MDARALVGHDGGTVSLEQVTLPDPGPTEVAIAARYSGVSVGTERNLLTGTVSWGPFPICTGYQAIGEVTDVGAEVTGLEVGDTVWYRENATAETDDGRAVSPTSGTHCSHAVVDATGGGPGRVPEGADLAAASLFVLPAVATNGVDRAGVRVDDLVLVQGVGLVGLGVVAAAHRRGATVVAADPVDDRRAVAARLGADHLVDPDETPTDEAVRELADEGADVVFEATGVPDLVDPALECVRPEGTFVFQGDYGDRDVSFYFRRPHHRQVTAHFPCGDGGAPCRRAVFAQLASGALPWEETVTHRLAPDEAPAFYEGVVAADTGAVGAVVDWT